MDKMLSWRAWKRWKCNWGNSGFLSLLREEEGEGYKEEDENKDG